MSQHLIQRGTDRLDIFRCDGDRLALLTMLRNASQLHRSAIHGYVLMKTHFHVLATADTLTSIEKTMHGVGTRYARYFNRRYARVGALFEGRYKAPIVHDERYWMTCLRYIELNPVRAGVVATPAEYRWSSYRAHALGESDPLLTPHQCYLDLGATPTARQHVWERLCAVDLTPEELNRIRFAVFEDRLLRNPEIVTIS